MIDTDTKNPNLVRFASLVASNLLNVLTLHVHKGWSRSEFILIVGDRKHRIFVMLVDRPDQPTRRSPHPNFAITKTPNAKNKTTNSRWLLIAKTPISDHFCITCTLTSPGRSGEREPNIYILPKVISRRSQSLMFCLCFCFNIFRPKAFWTSNIAFP